MRTALDWLVSGRIFDAQEAQEKGLVNRLFAPEELLPEATAFAERLAQTSSSVTAAGFEAAMPCVRQSRG